MKKRIKWITYLLIGALLFSDVSIPSYAARDVSGNNPGEEEELPEIADETQEEEPIAEEETLYDAGTILSILPLEKDSYTVEYKFGLERMLEDFPEKIKVKVSGKDTTVSLPVTWACKENYDERLSTFHFVPEFRENVAFAEDVAIPELTLKILNANPVHVFDDSEEINPRRLPTHNIDLDEEILYAPGSDYYNAFEEGLLPKVRQQNPYGSCWAHASIAGIENSLIKQRLADTSINLSELQLMYFGQRAEIDPEHLRDIDVVENLPEDWADGGKTLFGMSRFLKQIGATKEASVPYSKVAAVVENGLDDSYSSDRTYAGLFSSAICAADDRMGIKYLIKNYGCALANYWHSESGYSAIYNSYYTSKKIGGGHAITIVGWDDHFPKEHFVEQPEHDGAWLIRNSWGVDDYGENGYFWMSYEDYGLLNKGDNVLGFCATKDLKDHIYSYWGGVGSDIYGDVAKSSYTAKTIFPVHVGEKIARVSFDCFEDEVAYDVTVKAQGHTYRKSGTTEYSGLCTVEFSPEEVIPLTEDTDVVVEVTIRMQDGSESKWLEVGHEIDYGVRHDENTVTWFRGRHTENKSFYSYVSGGRAYAERECRADNVVALFTDDAVPQADEKLTILCDGKVMDTIQGHVGESKQLTVDLPSGYTAEDVVWSSSDTEQAIVSASGLVTFCKGEGASIIATTEDGRFSDEIYAQLLPYKITWHLEGGSFGNTGMPKNYYPGEGTIYLKEGPYRKGYELEYFYLDNNPENRVPFSKGYYYTGDVSAWGDGSTEIFFPGMNLDAYTEDLDIYVKWTKLPLSVQYMEPASMLGDYNAAYYEQSIDADDLVEGVALPLQTDTEDGAIRYLTDVSRKPADYKLSYFSLDAAGKKKISRLTLDDYFGPICFSIRGVLQYTQKNALKIYPQYEPIPSLENTYTITYVNDGSHVGSNPTSYKAGSQGLKETISLLVPTKRGYNFQGWYMDEAFAGSAYAAIPKGTTGDLTFYAKWEKINYTLVCNPNGGNLTGSAYRSYDVDMAFDLPVPTREGYIFEGWYDNSECQGSGIFSIPKGTIGNKILFAKWVLPSYTIRFNRNLSGASGTMADMTGLSFDGSYNLSQAKFTKPGYQFTGWNTKANGSGTSYKDKQSISHLSDTHREIITLYAQWKKIDYRISYVLNGGTMVVANPTKYQVDTAITFKNPVKAGNTFAGWFTDAACTKAKSALKKGSTGNLTLYALWVSNGQLKSAKNKSGKKVKLSWKANTAVSGYLVEYATDKNFKKGKKSKTVKSGKTASVTLSKLKKKKTYYFRVAPYLKKGTKTYYGAWSAVKKVRIKK